MLWIKAGGEIDTFQGRSPWPRNKMTSSAYSELLTVPGEVRSSPSHRSRAILVTSRLSVFRFLLLRMRFFVPDIVWLTEPAVKGSHWYL